MSETDAEYIVVFKVGDSVRLNSGGPVMTIGAIDSKTKSIYADWFYEGKIDSASFKPECIRLVTS